MKPTKRIEDLIHKLLRKSISQTELKELNNWYSADQDKEEVNVYSEKDTDKELVKMRMFNRIKMDIEKPNRHVFNSVFTSSRIVKTFSVAATIVFFISIGYLVFLLSSGPKIDNTKYITKVVERGEKSKLTLVDGTIIWLNSDSILKFPTKFNSTNREIELQGEGYFKVVRNENHPFVIRTANTITTVLGTSFNIKAYENEITSVTVTSGKVLVKIPNESSKKEANHILVKNDQITYNHNTGKAIKEKVIADNGALWTKGLLVFDGNNLEEVAQIIERWFNVEVDLINNESPNSRFYGQYNGEKLYNILESLKYSLKIKYEAFDNKILINAKNCK